MRFISWNVNGLRACAGKGFFDFFTERQADFFCVQEIKMKPEQFAFDVSGYKVFINSAERPGYSGTAVFAKHEPLALVRGIGIPAFDAEGRAITLEYPGFYLVNVYTPNSQHELARLPFRMEWEDELRAYLARLNALKPVILCGDMNVAHNKIDLANPGDNTKNPGFTREEREKMTALLESGFSDTFRQLYPDRKDAYTWWTYRMKARERNIGWRIDYFLVSHRISEAVADSIIYSDVMGSDHCPVGLELSAEL